MTQVWIVKAERTIVGGYDNEVGTMFKMAFDNYADARRVHEKGYFAFQGQMAWRWSISMIPADDVEYAEHDIEQLAKEFSTAEVNE